jgi:hypothetical protein
MSDLPETPVSSVEPLRPRPGGDAPRGKAAWMGSLVLAAAPFVFFAALLILDGFLR